MVFPDLPLLLLQKWNAWRLAGHHGLADATSDPQPKHKTKEAAMHGSLTYDARASLG
jgi:hypothetical protein